MDDDETLGVVISPTAITVQAGGSNSFTVVLGSLPSGDVTVSLAGHEGAVLSLTGIDNDNALTFTQDNWNTPQTVSVSAAAAAQTSTFTIGHSVTSADDPEYDGATAADVGVSVLEAPSTHPDPVGGDHFRTGTGSPGGRRQHLLHGAEPPARRGRDGHSQQPHRQLRRDGYSEEPDVHRGELVHAPDGDGDGRAGRRRRQRLRDGDPRDRRRRLRRSNSPGCGGHRRRRRDGLHSAEQDHR